MTHLEPADPADSTEPADPADPADSTGPAGPGDSAGPADSTGPAGPGDSAGPGDGRLWPEAEDEWARLRVQMDFAAGFWLGFAFTPDPEISRVFERRLSRLVERRGGRLVTIDVPEPGAASSIPALLLAPDTSAATCVWVRAIHAGRSWPDAAGDLFMRLNERRDALRRHLPGGLVFALRPADKPLVRIAAPDLWSVRSLVLALDPGDALDAAAAPGPRFIGSETNPGPDHDSVPTLLPGVAVASAGLALTSPFAPPSPELTDPAGSTVRPPNGGTWAGTLLTPASANGEVGRLLREVDVLLDAERPAEAVALSRRALAALGPAASEQDLAATLLWASRAEQAAGDADAADAHAARALALLPAADRRAHAELLDRIADTALERGETGRALTARAEELARARSAAAGRLEDPAAAQELAATLTRAGDTRAAVGDARGALEAYTEGLDIDRRRLAERGDSPVAQRDAAASFARVGDASAAAGDTAAALDAYAEGLEVGRRLLSAYPDSPDALRGVAGLLRRLARVEAVRGDRAGAAAAAQEADALERRLADLSGPHGEPLPHA